MNKEDKKWARLEILVELIMFGIVVGIIEDLIAIKLTTGDPITFKVVAIVVAVAIPFAVLGEVVFDRIDLTRILKRMFGKKRAA